MAHGFYDFLGPFIGPPNVTSPQEIEGLVKELLMFLNWSPCTVGGYGILGGLGP